MQLGSGNQVDVILMKKLSGILEIFQSFKYCKILLVAGGGVERRAEGKRGRGYGFVDEYDYAGSLFFFGFFCFVLFFVVVAH